MGYDTLFDPAMDDHQLARLARAEGRVLLTRDRELAQRRGIDSVLIQSEHLDQQLVQLLAELELDCAGSFSRCPVCNERLVDLDREEARERVPAYVACTQEIFKLCPGCQRVYWRGSHRQQMEERLARLVTKRNGG